ncbi:CBD9-like protein [Basidiobolus meristosporus CBS 931.73]|uniref:CBD9-like protein n=1 Tax=Basidiobolus meristosporus CBS 931.73 TaxID=1314790 RepID=A0A1Y1YH94_9FUNG|nr:CBD9-like protein [Basidiobolus meristosporus CBS 931.73]|eukprot:ORX96994.1 CBD9-like protein [Basidiobolus meristosporus CBS 931.73]
MLCQALYLISISVVFVSASNVKRCDLPLPKSYATLPAHKPPKIDGHLDDGIWDSIAWSSPFSDIKAGGEVASEYLARFKYTYDEEYFYVGAEIFDPNAVDDCSQDRFNFKNSTFRVYIDPLRTNHNYKELQITPFGNIKEIAWSKPPADGGVPNEKWSLGPKSHGTTVVNSGKGKLAIRNNTGRKSWTLEWAISQDALLTDYRKRGRFDFNRRPSTQFGVFGFRMSRRRNNNTPLEQYRHTWTPQYSEDIQNPEWWGSVFLGDEQERNQTDPTEVPRFVLSQVYRAQVAYKSKHGCYTNDISKLNIQGPPLGECSAIPTIHLGDDRGYTAQLTYQGVVGKIRQDRYITFEPQC